MRWHFYNPSNNTSSINAFINYVGATTNDSIWNGIVTGGRQLNGAGNNESYNQPGSQNYLIPSSLVKGAPGVFWAVDYTSNGTSLLGGINVYEGIWNSNTNSINWSINNIFNSVVNPSYAGDLCIGFDPTGTIGWIGYMGDVNSYGYYSPYFSQTTNGGATWSNIKMVDLNQYSCIYNNTGGLGSVVANYECDLTVDAN